MKLGSTTTTPFVLTFLLFATLATVPSFALGSGYVLERTPLGDVGGLAHYRLQLPTGSGSYNLLSLHRVVRESGPWQPAPTSRPVLLTHGGLRAFAATYLGPAPDVETSFAAYLADQGHDVWGIDARWTLIDTPPVNPAALADLTLDTDLDDLDRALAAIRIVRLLEGHRSRRAHLLGFSRGGALAYAYASRDAGRPRWARRLHALTIVDALFVTDDPQLRQEACDALDTGAARLATGTTFDDGTFFANLGRLAATAPDDTSALAPPLTNRQLVLLLGFDAAPSGSVVPFFHFVAGTVVDPFDFALVATPEARWIDVVLNTAPVLPIAPNQGIQAVTCARDDVPWDDHLADIDLPVLYIGAAGGIGEYGHDTLDRLTAADVTVETFAFNAPARANELGHFDLILGTDGPTTVWPRINEWLASRP